MQTDNKMGTATINKLILTMSLPPLFSMFLQYSYNLIDSAFVAHLSENALTAVSLSFPLTTIMNATSIWVGVGINVLIAGYLGRKKQTKANSIASTGLFLSFILGLILNLIVLAASRTYFQAFTSNDEIFSLCIYTDTEHGSYCNTENAASHWKHDCAHVVSDCRCHCEHYVRSAVDIRNRSFPETWYLRCSHCNRHGIYFFHGSRTVFAV